MTPFAVLSALGALQQVRATAHGWSRRIIAAAIYGGTALVFVLITIAFLAAALFLWLTQSPALSPVAAALIVAGILLVLAILAGLLARHAIRRGRGGAMPTASHEPDIAGTLGVNPNVLYALVAGLLGGLLATQFRSGRKRKD